MARKGDGIYRRGAAWWLDFTHKGVRHQVALGRKISRSVAAEIAAVKRASILKGEAGIGKKRKDLPFEKAAEIFLQWVKANKRHKTYVSYNDCIKQLLKSFSGNNLSEIHPFLIEKHKQRRITEDAKVALNREITCLKTLFYRCIDWKKYEGDNPVRRIKGVEESKGRIRFLSPEEEDLLLANSEEPLRTIILCGIHAGLRIQSEALTLRRENVDLKNGFLTVEAAYAKGKETKTIPLNSILKEAFERLLSNKKASGDYVFTTAKGEPYRSIKTAFTTACTRAKLHGVTPHTLRHTFASRLGMSGIDPKTIMELGGWKDLTMVMRYTHLSTDHKREAVERIAKNSTTVFTTVGFDAQQMKGAKSNSINRVGR